MTRADAMSDQELTSDIVGQLRQDAESDERHGIPGAYFERRIATLRAAASLIEELVRERDACRKFHTLGVLTDYTPEVWDDEETLTAVESRGDNSWLTANLILTIRTLRTERDRLREALREMLRYGEHEGDCTDEFGGPREEWTDGACPLHIAASDRRATAARASLTDRAEPK